MIITCDRCQERLVIVKLKTDKPQITVTCPVCGENMILYTAQIQGELRRQQERTELRQHEQRRQDDQRLMSRMAELLTN